MARGRGHRPPRGHDGHGLGAERARYGRLRDWTGWDLLPAVFVHGRFVGGAEEAYALLRDAQ
ncbi:MAG: hypothetical protein U5K73_00080 [Halofilum sp. (in: g-proteobacteria)]|nr:hypothetical protein [Halofilum sp. (in: g-proteobacteria)]